eukprot:CAMPEP_0173103240 /NCGR_PEP_ID=MMETSP1102-20130122/38215_1 /TAXON_ID=49646 /ORGANISM="Geminigera sp., Strain Caron Lab Isolate" /LENGTH=112 /DNA_ID=CAMNT_0013997903 /DNA_START=134 /DNA_END=471 /DNA_ORIENTATION=+
MAQARWISADARVLSLKGISAEEGIVAEGVDMVCVDMESSLIHLLCCLVLPVHCLKKSAVVAKSVDMVWVRGESALIHAFGTLEVRPPILQQQPVIIEGNSISTINLQSPFV